jgi:hypothetical protein
VTADCPVWLVVNDGWLEPAFDEEGRPSNLRALEQVDRLAQELAEDDLISPRVVPFRALSKDPSRYRKGLFLVYEEGAAPAIAASLAEPVQDIELRIFVLAAHRRMDVIAALERSGGPGCIESRRLFVWQSEPPEEDPAGGVFGRKDVGEAIGATWEGGDLWESQHYAMLYHDVYDTLPRLLAAYLAGFCRLTQF